MELLGNIIIQLLGNIIMELLGNIIIQRLGNIIMELLGNIIMEYHHGTIAYLPRMIEVTWEEGETDEIGSAGLLSELKHPDSTWKNHKYASTRQCSGQMKGQNCYQEICWPQGGSFQAWDGCQHASRTCHTCTITVRNPDGSKKENLPVSVEVEEAGIELMSRHAEGFE